MLSSCSNIENLNTNDTRIIDSAELLFLGKGPTLNIDDLDLVHEIFERFANTCPADIALSWDNKSYTYRELKEWSDRIAQNLLSAGTYPTQRIGILMDSCASMIASALGILKCGATYVPMDATQPESRIAKFITNSDVSIVLINSELISEIINIDCKYIVIEECFVDTSSKSLNSSFKSSPVSLNDAAYLIYTSGSAGEPKGVVIGHQELAYSTLARRIVYPEKSVFLLVSPISCDSSIAGIWGTLTMGGHLVVASYDECRDPEALIALINKYKITMTLCIPSLYENLLDVIENSKIETVKTLKTIIVAGETLHQSLINRHFKIFGKTSELINEYGPTESTVWASYRRFTLPDVASIGRPLPGISLYILNEDLKLIPKGEVGEIFIGGRQLAKEYFGNKEATEKVFLPDPFVKAEGSRMYRTGDLGCWNDDGTLNFLGRKDHQVKIRGYRIELGAIESVLCAIPHVREAVVVANKESTMLAAFVVCNEKISEKTLRELLFQELPLQMIPSTISIMDHLPLISSGKVDRNALTQLINFSEISSLRSELALNDQVGISERVSKAWGEVLNIDIVPEDVNFFDLGGHSLMVFKLQQYLEKHTGFKPPVVALFRYTTIGTQADYILSQINCMQENNSPLEAAA
ncbi:MAG: non-ribosomal peptide synthetase [Candidatus Paracaedibacteraceae bacterium]|nr:non-ribosomal peptide synthetase [Candidatus Paracaedibacteraceae bacterium]